MDKDQPRIIDGNGENTRASIERATFSALMRDDHVEFNRLLDILEQRPQLTLATVLPRS